MCNTCDVCGKTSAKVCAGRWVFYCGDNPECKAVDIKKTYDNEMAPAMEDGEMPEVEVAEMFI